MDKPRIVIGPNGSCEMSAISLRLPDYLRAMAREVARKEGVSMNQLIATALAEKLSALATEDYLGARAQRGSREAYDRALAKVADREPQPGDEI